MEQLHEWIGRVPVIGKKQQYRQFIIFCFVGVTNTLWDFFIYLALTAGWFGFTLHPLLANPISFTISVANSYILNQRFTFAHQHRGHVKQVLKFITVNLLTLALYEGFLFAGIHIFSFHHLIVKVAAIGVVTLWNFTAHKYWTFQRST